MEWISTNDSLPEDGDLILMYDKADGVTIGTYSESGGWRDILGEIHFLVTHWAIIILPEA